MRLTLCAVCFAVVLWAASGSAQMRGGSAHFAGAARSSVAARSATATRTTASPSFSRDFVFFTPATKPGVRSFRPFGPFSNFQNQFFNESPFLIGREHLQRFNGFFGPFNNRFAFGSVPFGWGWGGGWGWPYLTDYTDFNADQNEQQYQAQVEANEQLQASLQDDQRRHYELQRQLADQRAADAAAARNIVPTAAAPTSTQREPTPAILVFRDHRQEEVRSYAITATTVYAFNPSSTRKIAVSDLDIPATIAANEQRGVVFKVPTRKQ